VAEPIADVGYDAVMAGAGAPPRDDIDAAYRDGFATYEDAKNADVGPESTSATLDTSDSAADTARFTIDADTLAEAQRALRTARSSRARGDRAGAAMEYRAVLRLLDGAHGLYSRPAEAAMAVASLALSELAGRDGGTARDLAAGALEHARRSGDAGLERRARHRLARLSR
jgi:hypothetical protein